MGKSRYFLALLCACLLCAGPALAAEETPAPEPTAEPASFGTAIVANPDASDLLNLREGPGKDHASLGLYYNGVEALCWSDPSAGEWVLVTVGQVSGYMQRQYLCLPDEEGAVEAATPAMVVQGAGDGQGLNLRESPSLEAAVLGLCPLGQQVSVLGVSGDWAHVRVDEADEGERSEPSAEDSAGGDPAGAKPATAGGVGAGRTGYVLRDYLSREAPALALTDPITLTPAPLHADATPAPAEATSPVDTVLPAATYSPLAASAAARSPSLKQDGRGAEGFHHFARGYTVVGTVSELQDGSLYGHSVVSYDNGTTPADAITAFRLYLNGEPVAVLQPYDREARDPEASGLPDGFRGTFSFAGDIQTALLVPVLEAAGEHPEEAVALFPR